MSANVEKRYRLYMGMGMWQPFKRAHENNIPACVSHINSRQKMWWTERFAMEQVQKYFRVKRIQAAWRRCISDPNYAVCKRRLLREFAESG